MIRISQLFVAVVMAMVLYKQGLAQDALQTEMMLEESLPEAERLAPSEEEVISEPTEKETREIDVLPEEKPSEVSKRYTAAKLRVLNKVTARTEVIEAPFATVMHAGNLEIIAHRCVERELLRINDHAALLEIWELKTGEGPEKLFSGWMFSSQPAASNVEHPVYDVWVERCTQKSAEE